MSSTEAGSHFQILDRVHRFVDGFDFSGDPRVDAGIVLASGLRFFSSEENFPHRGVNKLMRDLAVGRETGGVELEVGLMLDHSQRARGLRRESDRAWVIWVSSSFPSAILHDTANEWSAIVNIAQQMQAIQDMERNSSLSPSLRDLIPAQARQAGDAMELSFLKVWKSFDPFYA